MKTKKSLKNLFTAFIGQFFGIIISFISRIIFIKYLGAEVLGIDGLFTNIITFLSLVELGIGPAMSYSLYKPLADNDHEKIKSLMHLYKILYRIIGILVLILGLCLLPIYKNLIATVPKINYLDLIFMLFVLNTSISYFFSYKRSIIICDEKKYITTIIKYITYFILTVMQIIILILTKNYLLFLSLQIIFTLLENIVISIKADQLYPYLKDKNFKSLNKSSKLEIKKNVFAMLFHKLGGMVVNSTDNIIIAKFIGIVSVGINTNYLLITNAIVTFTNQFFESIVASIGNIGTTKNVKKLKDIFNKAFFFNYYIFGIISCILMIILNDFISLWLGREYLFATSIVALIVLNFYLRGIRKSALTFRDALGLFWYDRYKPLLECVINLIISIILAKKLGVFGVFLGTAISCVTTSLWVEPYVLYKYGFKCSVKEYFKKLGIYTLSGLVSLSIIITITNLITNKTLLTLVIKVIITVIIFNVIFISCFFRTKEFKYYTNFIKNLVSNKRSDKDVKKVK